MPFRLAETKAGAFLGTLEYSFEKDGGTVHKQVHYFPFTATEPGRPLFGEKPTRTKELRWINKADADALPLVNEDLRPIILKAFDLLTS